MLFWVALDGDADMRKQKGEGANELMNMEEYVARAKGYTLKDYRKLEKMLQPYRDGHEKIMERLGEAKTMDAVKQIRTDYDELVKSLTPDAYEKLCLEISETIVLFAKLTRDAPDEAKDKQLEGAGAFGQAWLNIKKHRKK